MTPLRLFISNMQKEFAGERAVLRDYMRGDPLLRRSFAPFVNAEYRKLTGATERTAARDLDDMVKKGLLVKTAKTGRGTAYRLPVKSAINATNQPAAKPDKKPPNPTDEPVSPEVRNRKRRS